MLEIVARTSVAHAPAFVFMLQLGLVVGVLPMRAASAAEASEGVRSAAATPRGAKKHKRDKALVEMLERPSFPHEQVEAPELVKPKVFPTTRERHKPARATAAATTTGLQPAATREEAPKREAPPEAPVVKPGNIAVSAPPIPEAEREAARPTAAAKPAVSAETGSRIDNLLGKAFTEPPSDSAADHAGPGSAPGHLDPDEIASAMKPVRTSVKKGCIFNERGVVVVRVEVGAGGRVTTATPEGALADRPQAECVVKAVKAAKFPGSANASFRYPFPVK